MKVSVSDLNFVAISENVNKVKELLTERKSKSNKQKNRKSKQEV